MTFELFTRTRRPFRSARVSITQAGFYINIAASRKYFGNMNYVLLYFDSERQVIGLKPVSQSTEYSYRLFPRGEARIVNCTTFLRYVRIEYKKGISISPTWNEQEEMLELALVSEEEIRHE